MIEKKNIVYSLRLEIPVTELFKVKEELHQMNITSNVMNDYTSLKLFYSDLVNVLSDVDMIGE